MKPTGAGTDHPACACAPHLSLLAVVRADVDRYRFQVQHDAYSTGRVGVTLRALLFYPALYGVVTYRLAHAAWSSRLPEPLRTVLVGVTVVLQHLITPYSGVEMSARAHVGPGLFINHSRGVVIGSIDAGSNLTVSHGVTLGSSGGPLGRDCPSLGDRVWLGVGCVVTGPVRVGDDAVVGANAVVLKDVPQRGVAVGVPARLVSRQGSFDRVFYRGSSADTGRAESLLGLGQTGAVVEE